MKVFLDANLLLAAAWKPEGTIARLIRQGHDAGWQWITSDYALDEAYRNLSFKRASALPELALIAQRLQIVCGSEAEPCPAHLPEKDRPILAAAIRWQCDYLLTGDFKDFGEFMNQRELTGGVTIMSVAAFIDAQLAAKGL